MHQNRTCCFLINRCNVTFKLVQQNFSCSHEGFQCKFVFFLVNEDINIVYTLGSIASVGTKTQKIGSKMYNAVHSLTRKINISSVFFGLSQVLTKATHKLTYEKGNLIFFFCLCIFPSAFPPLVFTAAIPHFSRYKRKERR